jgi:chemotaxis protein CheC
MELSEEQLDALGEVGNIGAAHASTALEQMLGRRVSITVPKTVYPLPVEKMSTLFGNEDDVIVVLFFKILGDADGMIIMGFTEAQALLISNTLVGKDEGDMEFTEEKESALKEVGNILTGSYLNALSKFVGFNLMQSIPYMAHDMVGAVIDPFIIEISKTSDYALVIDTELIFDKKSIAGKCLTNFSKESFVSILEALEMHKK